MERAFIYTQSEQDYVRHVALEVSARLEALCRMLAIVAAIGAYFFTASILRAVFGPFGMGTSVTTRVCSFFCKLGLIFTDVKVELRHTLEADPEDFSDFVETADPLQKKKGVLVVGNHLSYIDMFVLNALFPTRFVTSVEIRDTPVLGWICRLANCIFVERRDRSNIDQEVGTLTQALLEGHNVVVFPEAGTSNGEGMRPFKKSMFVAAVNSQTHVLPVCLNYLNVNDEPLTLANRHLVLWYEEIPLFSHLWRMLGSCSARVRVDVLQPIMSNSHRELAFASQEQIRDSLIRIRD